jgi:hypothetical protein
MGWKNKNPAGMECFSKKTGREIGSTCTAWFLCVVTSPQPAHTPSFPIPVFPHAPGPLSSLW